MAPVPRRTTRSALHVSWDCRQSQGTLNAVIGSATLAGRLAHQGIHPSFSRASWARIGGLTDSQDFPFGKHADKGSQILLSEIAEP